MKDPDFIHRTIKDLERASKKASDQFSDLSPGQLSWQPDVFTWSINHCIQHLVIADRTYFPVLKAISVGEYKMSLWPKISPFSHLFGKMLKERMQEEVTHKMKTPKIFRPPTSLKGESTLGEYKRHVGEFIDYVRHFETIDLDKTIITSPAIAAVTYSLRDALTFLVTHEFRHLGQAGRLRELPDFPG